MKTKQLFTVAVVGLMLAGLTTGCDTESPKMKVTTENNISGLFNNNQILSTTLN